MLTVQNFLLVFSVAHLLNSICGESVGDTCTIESIPGICKRSSDCQQLSEYVKRGDVPPEFFGCGVVTSDNLICCPNAPLAKKTILKKLEPTLVWTQPKKTTTERATEKACRLLEDNIIGNPNIRLFSGSESIVELGEFPFMVGIGYKNSTPDRTYDILCGGTLIDAKFVLTAAHCITGHGNTPIIVRLGVTNNTDVEQIKNGLEIPVKKIHAHPQYDPELIYNDIGLLELEKSVKFSVNIYPTCLYTNIEDPPANSQLYITGWASAKIFDRSDVLLKAAQKIVPLNVCNKTLLRVDAERSVQHTQLCSDALKSERSPCYGDAGGPLSIVVDPTWRIYRVIGVISSGVSCGLIPPDISTRVAAYLDFIENIVWPNLK